MAEQESVAITTENIDQATPEQVDSALQRMESEDVAAAPVVEESVPPPDEGKVNIGALHEERQRRKALERQLEQDRQQTAQMLAYLREQAQQMARQQPQVPQPPPPDESVDPLGAQYYLTKQLASKVDDIGQRVEATRQEQEATRRAYVEQQAAERFRQSVITQEQQFKAQTPDYDTAVRHVLEKRVAEYEAVGVPKDQAELRVRQEAWTIAQAAMQRGENPAEVAYRFALASGYQKGGVSDTQRLEMQQKGQAAAAPRGNTGGGGVSLQALASMSNDEFDKLTKDPKQWKRLMGG